MRLLQILFDIIYLFNNRNEHYDCSKVNIIIAWPSNQLRNTMKNKAI